MSRKWSREERITARDPPVCIPDACSRVAQHSHLRPPSARNCSLSVSRVPLLRVYHRPRPATRNEPLSCKDGRRSGEPIVCQTSKKVHSQEVPHLCLSKASLDTRQIQTMPSDKRKRSKLGLHGIARVPMLPQLLASVQQEL